MTKSNTNHVPPIECRDVWKVFGENSASALKEIKDRELGKDEARAEFDCVVGVSDVSLQVERGEILCIMGLSGSGKSTLLRHINRLIEPTAGQILINGQDIAKLDRKELQALRSRTIGMVFQHMALWPHRNIRDNVGFGLEVRGIGKTERFGAVERVLKLVKLQGWGERYPDELSGGMQQRVGLARALASDPDILLMDEPFSALDPLIRAELQDQFLALSSELKKTTLFVTHDLEEAVKLGHRVAIMKDGKVVQIGTPADIMLRPKTEYVSAFVEGLPRLKFMKVSDAMEKPKHGTNADGSGGKPASIPYDRPLIEAMDMFLAGHKKILVTKRARTIGIVSAKTLMAAVREGIQ